MKMRRIMLICGLFLVFKTAYAQVPNVSKFGTWTGFSVSKSLTNRWSLDGEVELRTQDAMKAVNRWSSAVGVEYKVNGYLKVEGTYKFLYNYYMSDWKEHYSGTVSDGYNVTDSYWLPRHRLMLDITGHHKYGGFALSLTERLQFTGNGSKEVARDKMRYDGSSLELSSTDSKQISSENSLHLRTCLKAKYEFKGTRFSPYAAYYLYNNLLDNMGIKKYRLSAGVEYALNKRNAIDIGYLYVNSHDSDEADDNILDVTYKVRF